MNYSIDYQGDMGGAGGGGGGGYQPQSSQNDQQQRPARKAYDEQTLIPTTIAMLHKSVSNPSAELELPDGRPIHHVKIIGAVRSCEEQSTNITFQIEDGTGLIEAKQWLDDNDCSAAIAMRQEAQQQPNEHMIYVRVIGQIKDYNQHKVLVAHSIRRITDLNAMTHHFLEVVFSAQQYKRGEQIGPGAVLSGRGVNMNMNVNVAGAGAGIANAGVAVQQQTAAVGGNALKEQILNFIRVEGDGSDIGAPMDRCITLLQQNGFSEPQVRTAVEELSSEGHIYSTIDENHYQFAF